MSDNPLLTMTGLPPFSRITAEHVEPAIDTLLAENRKAVEQLLAATKNYTWDNLIQPLEDMEDRLSRVWSPISHMNSVVNSEALRNAYNACLPKLSEYGTEMGQNIRLYQAYKAIKDSKQYQQLDTAQKKVIDNALRDFHLSGVDLPDDKKARFKKIQQQLSQLTTKFEENVLDATQGWTKHIEEEIRLAGLPESARAMAKQAAAQRQLSGWVFTLDFPSYFAVLTYAEDRELRSEMHQAYVTRASDQGPTAGKWDNSKVMDEILALRYELAQLLGYKNYAERSLVTKMADTPERVLQFLHDLAKRSKPEADKELHELEAFARNNHGIEKLEPWDIGYYSEKLRQHTYAISQEELKPYFPETSVIPGMFEVVKRLYGISIQAVDGADVWHPDVRFYEIRDEDGVLRGE